MTWPGVWCEVMHPVIGPLVEADALYVVPSRLAARLAQTSEADPTAPLVLLDVGLGAGSNAVAAWRVSVEPRVRNIGV